ncbi:MAG: hypothetical protein AAGE52_11095 [Myxococcota bacterium]
MKQLLVLLVAITSFVASSEASAQNEPNRLVGYLALGLGGEVEADLDGGGSFEVDLDASVGLGFRYELMLGKLLSIAPMIEWLTYEVDAPGADREHILDFDVFIKFRGTIRAGRQEIELYGGIPVGFSFATDVAGTDNGVGFNLGIMGGAALFFGKFGLFTEIGWRMHQLWDDGNRFAANQAGLNFGGLIRL